MRRFVSASLAIMTIGTIGTIGLPDAVATSRNDLCTMRGSPTINAEAIENGYRMSGCDPTGMEVTYQDGAVSVPSEGESTSLFVTQEGGGYSLAVSHESGGLITSTLDSEHNSEWPVPTTDDMHGGNVSPSASVDPCEDVSFSHIGGRWVNPNALSISANRTDRLPSNITSANFKIVVDEAASRLRVAANRCGVTYKPTYRIVLTYGRLTSNINGATNTCAARDDVSVLDFGNLSGTTLGLACTTRNILTNQMWEADIRLDNTNRSWVTTANGCTGSRFDLHSVVTHEMGHALGLGHAVERGPGDLTMSPTLDRCDTSARRLGMGDVLGLYNLY